MFDYYSSSSVVTHSRGSDVALSSERSAPLFSPVAAFVIYGLTTPILRQRFTWVAVALAVSYLALTHAPSKAAADAT